MRKYLDIISATDVTPETVSETSAPARKGLKEYLDIVTEGYQNNTVHDLDVDDFVRGYIEAMLATTTDEANPDGGQPMNQSFTEDDIAEKTMDRIYADCRSFLHRVGPWLTKERHKGATIGSIEAHAGHDFWLTRCGHGAGFWDGDWEGEDDGRFEGQLTKAAKSFGNVDAYVGDDGKIYLS